MVEAAFTIPFMLLCIVGILYFGRASYIDQILLYAAQEGARAVAGVPNLSDPNVRDMVRGFDTSGHATNPSAVVYSVLGSANLLSNGTTGDLPTDAFVKILPWDSDGSAADQVPTGTVALRVQYPFSLTKNPFTGTTGNVEQVNINFSADANQQPVKFGDFLITEKATIAQTLYQGVN
jgi:hypothetical protein